ncbi:hypothetical protein PV326_014211 [Microctonus aethiopoides]|nr:hypothetical protein PV326_014211 [Microctonus aethiopoides]
MKKFDFHSGKIGLYLRYSYLIILKILGLAPFQVKLSEDRTPIITVSHFGSSYTMMQYTVFLSGIFERLKSLNKTYLKLGNISTNIPLYIIFVRKNPLKQSIVHDIINLRDAHRILSDICDKIEDLFAPSTLLSIIFFGSSTIHLLYIITISFFTKSWVSTNYAYAACFTWLVAQLYNLFVLTINVTRTIQESKRTASSIHLLLDRCTTNYQIEEELTEFSRELLHRKIEFNVYGMFSLDCSLFYLIILKIMGLAPFRIDMSDHKVPVFTVSHFGTVYNIILIIIFGIINSWAMMQYSLSLSGIFERLKSLNKTYLKLGNISTNIPLRILFVRKTPLKQSVIDDIINLRKAYRVLYEICDQIEELFALPTLLSIIFFGSSAVHAIYTIMLSLCIKIWMNTNQLRFSTGIWVVLQCYNIIVLTINVTRTIRESKQTANSIHLLLDRCTIDSAIEEELTEFSTELLHQKITFSVFGMFLLDCSLLYSVAGTIGTYIIILVQFQLK